MPASVGYMLMYLTLNGFLNAIIYGTIMYVNWHQLGILVDRSTYFDLFFPLGLCSTASLVGVAAVYLINGDW